MKRWIWAVVAGFSLAGCTSDGQKPDGDGGRGEVRALPGDAGEWKRAGQVTRYSGDDIEPYAQQYMSETRARKLRANAVDSLMLTQYRHVDWAKDPKNPDNRRLHVEMYIHQLDAGAAKTFQEWHSGNSISDVGDKAFADSDAIVFLRGKTVVRIRPSWRWETGAGGKPSIEVGKAIDAWLQGK